MQARSAVKCRSARVSEAVSPAKSASVAIGLIVVKSVAKSLLILINRGDMSRSVCFILIRTTDQARGKRASGISTFADNTRPSATGQRFIAAFSQRAHDDREDR